MYLRNDRQLLDGFRAGSARALNLVYLHYAPRVAQFLRNGFTFTSRDQVCRFRGLEKPFDLENATQEVFARAFQERARLAYDGIRPFTDYLLAITRNHILNELRRHQEQLVDAATLEQAAESDERGTVAEQTLEEREVSQLLATFLDQLPAGDRAYFTVRFHEERNQVEAARALGITRIRARRVEARIKRELLLFMKERGYLTRIPMALAGALGAVRR